MRLTRPYNNNHEYLERLTRTGPKRLHILYKYILSKFNAYNMNAHTHTRTHTDSHTHARTHARTHSHTHTHIHTRTQACTVTRTQSLQYVPESSIEFMLRCDFRIITTATAMQYTVSVHVARVSSIFLPCHWRH